MLVIQRLKVPDESRTKSSALCYALLACVAIELPGQHQPSIPLKRKRKRKTQPNPERKKCQ